MPGENSGKIIKYPDDFLRKRTRKVTDFESAEVSRLILDMQKIIEEAKGIGLAAPQVGSDLRICLINVDSELLILVNPEIKSYSRKKETAEEGCLSFPGKFLPIERSLKVKVKAQHLSGKKIKIKAEGLLARVMQHEIDHLDGVLFIDRLKEHKK